MNYPDDATLIARGKQATLKKERWEQITRVQNACRTLQGNATLILTDAQRKPPEDRELISETMRVLDNIDKAHSRIVELDADISALDGDAWGVI